MTGQSLYCLAEGNLQHKILAIVEEKGAEKARYALKLLQSEQALTFARARATRTGSCPSAAAPSIGSNSTSTKSARA